MTGLLRKTMLLACGGVLAASSAMASVPSAETSSVPCGLNLVGTTGGVADVRGSFTIVVRDLASNPVPGSSVVISFAGCAPDIRVCSVQPAGGVSANCVAPRGEITAVTGGDGTVNITVVGGTNNTGGSPAAGFKCATVFADGVNLGPINVGAFDQNGASGVSVADLSLFAGDFFDGDHEGRSDYDCSGAVAVADLSIFAGVFFGGGSTTSCAAYCF